MRLSNWTANSTELISFNRQIYRSSVELWQAIKEAATNARIMATVKALNYAARTQDGRSEKEEEGAFARRRKVEQRCPPLPNQEIDCAIVRSGLPSLGFLCPFFWVSPVLLYLSLALVSSACCAQRSSSCRRFSLPLIRFPKPNVND